MRQKPRIIRTILLPIVLILLICMSSNEKPWIKELDKNGITIYLRDYQGSQFKEFKAMTIVKAPIKNILNLLTDFKSYPKWVFGNKNTIMFEKKTMKISSIIQLSNHLNLLRIET